MKEKFKKQLLIDVLTVVVGYVALSLLMRFGVINDYVKGILLMACINIILTVSLNITSGFLGELALGHAGFMAVGAYAAALFSKSLSLIPAVEFPLAILVGGFAALIAGYIVSIPALRLKGDYLAIITLAAGEIIRNILKNLDIVGGTKGYTGIPGYTNFAWAYFVAVICIFASKSLIQSRHGRSIISIREDEIAAEASGVDTNRYKIIGFIFSAFFAGVGGALYAHYLRFLQPGIFTLNKSIEILVMDNGPGAPEDIAEHLFEPFVSGKPEGKGLGLPLVEKLVRDMGGIVQYARERPPEMTVFRILLPRARA